MLTFQRKRNEMSPDTGNVQQLVGHLFRHEAGKMAAVLTRVLGFSNIETAEDIVQDTLLKALNAWKFQGIPKNPSAWLYAVAKNNAIDIVRKEKRLAKQQQNILLDSEWTLGSTMSQLFLSNEIEDSQLRMIFACCHPAIPYESQIALTLKVLCGLSVHEIAQGFLTHDETITKRIYRAKEKIKEAKIELEAPVAEGLKERLESVLKSLYLLFSEGYTSSNPDAFIRQDLCEEAMRLCILLTKNSITNTSSTNALLSLMCFQASRFDSRINDDGTIILLKDQDRTKWNQALIAKGQYYLEISGRGDEISEYHLEAALAACHALAKNFEETNWGQIVYLYDLLSNHKQSPVLALNRAIAIGYHESPQRGIEELLSLTNLTNNHYFHTALGDFYNLCDQKTLARSSYENAIELTESKKELQLLYKKINEAVS